MSDPTFLRASTRLQKVALCFDSSAAPTAEAGQGQSVDWLRVIPFVRIHLACLAVLWVGFDRTAILVAVGLYVIRMFGITGFYHRYYSHRAFTANRAVQFLAAVIGIYESARREMDFIKQYIFPGSCIPSVSVLARAASATDLRLVNLEDITPHYAETPKRWRERFEANWVAIRAQGFTEEFRRLWQFYFSYCEGGFREAVIGDVQLLFAKPGGVTTIDIQAPRLMEAAA